MVLQASGSGMVVGPETAVNVRFFTLEELNPFHYNDCGEV